MKYLFPLAFIIYLIAVTSCGRNNNFDTSSGVMLEFSADTLRFDTVFTELGSATRTLKLYNRRNKPIKITSISIKNDPTTFFRLNIDGLPTNTSMDVEIAANDSLYIFGEVTIDPDQPLSNSPFVIEDEIIFEVNGNTQTVLLEAWGQNANYFPDRFQFGELNEITCSGGLTWTNEKPHVVYGTVIFNNCDLTIEAGTRIHVHGGLASDFDPVTMEKFFFNDGRIVMAAGSKLTINGTIDKPVIITGDRLEEPFQDVSGQWWGILLFKEEGNPNSTEHEINYAEIKNSIVGIVVDSAINLTMNNSKIYNTSNAGLVGVRSGTVNVNNSLFYENGGNAVRILRGGNYNFTHCTLASFGVDASALYMSNALCIDPLTCNPCLEYRLNASFKNSIIYGSRKDEIDLFDFDECNELQSNPLNYTFENCIVRVEELTDNEKYEDFFVRCDSCQNADGSSVVFFDTNDNDYHLDTLSIAENKAQLFSNPLFDLDLDGIMRGNEPDVGCFEFVPQ